MPPRAGIVLVHFNCAEDTARCLSSLSELEYDNFFVIVVENGSSDGSGAIVRAAVEERGWIFVHSDSNLGFAGGSNLGASHARDLGAELVWFLNADTAVSPRALSSLVDALDTKAGIAAAGSKIVYPANGKAAAVLWSAGGAVDEESGEIRMIGFGEPDRGQYDAVRDCDYLPGCSVLVSVAALDRVGMLPEEYFMYFEETDWCRRARKLGYRLRYAPGSVVVHFFRDEKLPSPFNVYYYNRNTRLFWLRHGRPGIKLRVLWRTIFRDLPDARKGLREAPDHVAAEIFRAHLQSCNDFLCGRFGRQWHGITGGTE
jgi:GT2 family glycosyltransferase